MTRQWQKWLKLKQEKGAFPPGSWYNPSVVQKHWSEALQVLLELVCCFSVWHRFLKMKQNLQGKQSTWLYNKQCDLRNPTTMNGTWFQRIGNVGCAPVLFHQRAQRQSGPSGEALGSREGHLHPGSGSETQVVMGNVAVDDVKEKPMCCCDNK